MTVMVTDDGTASTQVTLTVDPTAVGEGASATTVTVTGTLDHAVRTEGTDGDGDGVVRDGIGE